MSRLCAKPTCSDPAVRWFEILPAQRRVLERSQPTASSVSLCDSHAARFSAPDGWAVESDTRATAPTPESKRIREAPAKKGSRLSTALSDSPKERPRQRKHDRYAPWFLAGSSEDEHVAPSTPLIPVALHADADDTSDIAVPSAGSLLHRAFHGPDRDSDVARAKTADRDSVTIVDENDHIADVGDLSTRLAERSAPDTYDVELPFPPSEPARHSAVS